MVRREKRLKDVGNSSVFSLTGLVDMPGSFLQSYFNPPVFICLQHLLFPCVIFLCHRRFSCVSSHLRVVCRLSREAKFLHTSVSKLAFVYKSSLSRGCRDNLSVPLLNTKGCWFSLLRT